MTPRKEQFEGCIMGLCLGDAIGFPAEGYPPSICQRYVTQVLGNKLAGPWVHYPYPFGQYSDDSQLTRELILSLIQCQGFVPEDYSARIAALYKNHKIIGFGKATESAAKQLLQGVPWTHSGVLPPSAGNGSAVRAVPLGLFYYNNPETMLQVAHTQSRITHQDLRCSAGAAVVAGAVSLLLHTASLEPADFLHQLSLWAKTYHAGFAEYLLRLQSWLEWPIPKAAEVIAQAGAEKEFESVWEGISPFVISSVLWSLYAFLKTPDDYWQTVRNAITVGGDVDTMAAMSGAFSGVHLGIEALPQELFAPLQDQGSWRYPQLLKLAAECHDKTMSGMFSSKPNPAVS